MKATVEKLEGSQAVIGIEVDAAAVNASIQRAYRKMAKEVNIPGFRRGKAPKKILENYIGKEPLYNEAIDLLMADVYGEALQQTNLFPIDRPDVEVVTFEEGKEAVFKAKVEVKPEPKLGPYQGLEVEKPEAVVSEQQVDNEIKELQLRHARLVDVTDGSIEEGDIAIIDFSGTKTDGEAVPGGSGENFSLEIGSGRFIKGFEEQLIGAKRGEEKEVKVTFPEDYYAVELRSQEVTFKVNVKEVKRKEYLAIDDEFAREVSEFDTLAEMKEDIKKRLMQSAEQAADREFRDHLVDRVVANAQVEVPEILVERRLDSHMETLRRRLTGQGLNLDQYLEANNKTESELREEYRQQAEESVKNDLVLEQIVKLEKIEVTAAEMDEQIEKLARAFGQNPEEYKQKLPESDRQIIEFGIIMDKAVDFLVNNNTAVPAKKEAEQEAAGE